MYVIAWQFDVHPGKTEAFEEAYGPHGAWSTLFARSESHLGTRLLRDTERSHRYVTLDLWTSEAAFQELHSRHQKEYEELDAACAGLTTAEVRLGAFESGVAQAEVI